MLELQAARLPKPWSADDVNPVSLPPAATSWLLPPSFTTSTKDAAEAIEAAAALANRGPCANDQKVIDLRKLSRCMAGGGGGGTGVVADAHQEGLVSRSMHKLRRCLACFCAGLMPMRMPMLSSVWLRSVSPARAWPPRLKGPMCVRTWCLACAPLPTVPCTGRPGSSQVAPRFPTGSPPAYWAGPYCSPPVLRVTLCRPQAAAGGCLLQAQRCAQHRGPWQGGDGGHPGAGGPGAPEL